MLVSSPSRFNVASLYLPMVQARPVAWGLCGCSGDLGMPLGQATDRAVWVHNSQYSQCHCEAASLVFQNLTLSTLALDPETSRRSRQAGRFRRERPWSGPGGRFSHLRYHLTDVPPQPNFLAMTRSLCQYLLHLPSDPNIQV